MSAKSPWLGSGWRQDAHWAADQLSDGAITDADAKLGQGRFSVEAGAHRDATYSAAGDARAGAYVEAEQRHDDRLAAIQRHFGHQFTIRGNPDASHAADFVEMVADPEGQFAPQPAEVPSGKLISIAYNGVRRQVRVDVNGRIVAENPVADDRWSNRGTFTGDTEAFMAAKRAGVGLKPDPDEPPPAPPIPPPPMIRAEAQPEPPPPGLLADIAAGLVVKTKEMMPSARGPLGSGWPTFDGTCLRR